MTGEEPMQSTPDENKKEEAMRLLSEAYNLDEVDQIWLSIMLDLDSDGRKELLVIAQRLAKLAASYNTVEEASAELIADAQSAQNKAFQEWDQELSVE